MVKTGPTSVNAGSNITYTITVSNAGPDGASDLTLDDVLPAGTTFVSLTRDSGPVAICSTPPTNTNGPISCTFPRSEAAPRPCSR